MIQPRYTASSGDNEEQTTTYDLLGRVSARSTVSGGIMSHAYDKWRRVTAMYLGGTTTTQAYDAWGRLTGRAQGGYSATYAFPPAADLRRYGDKLYSVTSDFPGEGDVTYNYGGDGKRRSRVAGASETWYNYDMGWNVLSEEDDADGATGALTATNVLLTPGAEVSALLADIAGASPASGAPRYYVTDHLGSTRGAYDASKAAAGTYEYSPYGGPYAPRATCPEDIGIAADFVSNGTWESMTTGQALGAGGNQSTASRLNAPRKEGLRSRGNYNRDGGMSGIGYGLGSTWIDPRYEPGPQQMYPGASNAWAAGTYAGGPTGGAWIPSQFRPGPQWSAYVQGFGDGNVIAPGNWRQGCSA